MNIILNIAKKKNTLKYAYNKKGSAVNFKNAILMVSELLIAKQV